MSLCVACGTANVPYRLHCVNCRAPMTETTRQVELARKRERAERAAEARRKAERAEQARIRTDQQLAGLGAMLDERERGVREGKRGVGATDTDWDQLVWRPSGPIQAAATPGQQDRAADQRRVRTLQWMRSRRPNARFGIADAVLFLRTFDAETPMDASDTLRRESAERILRRFP